MSLQIVRYGYHHIIGIGIVVVACDISGGLGNGVFVYADPVVGKRSELCGSGSVRGRKILRHQFGALGIGKDHGERIVRTLYESVHRLVYHDGSRYGRRCICIRYLSVVRICYVSIKCSVSVIVYYDRDGHITGAGHIGWKLGLLAYGIGICLADIRLIVGNGGKVHRLRSGGGSFCIDDHTIGIKELEFKTVA